MGSEGERRPEVIRTNRELRERFHRLRAGDVVAVVLGWAPGEEGLLLDLVTRGVRLFPPALAQWLSRSKVLQAQVLGPWMVPGTAVVAHRRGLMEVMGSYAREGIGPVVTKGDRGDCGLGVHLWGSVEDVFNHAGSGPLEFPFVIQPLLTGVTDVRVIWIGDYVEAYWRRNPHSFRNNLHWGGESGRYALSPRQMELCREVMARGRFPYAFIDLMVTQEGESWLSEIALRGGLRGARLSQGRYLEMVARLEEEFLAITARKGAGNRRGGPRRGG